MKKFVVILVMFLLAVPHEGGAAEVAVFNDLNFSNVIVCIDDMPVTKSNIVEEAAIFTTLIMNKKRKTKLESAEQKFYREQCKRSVNNAIARATVRKYAFENNIKPTEQQLDKSRKAFVKRYSARSRRMKRDYSLDDLKYMFGSRGVWLDNEIENIAFYQCVANHITSKKPWVSDVNTTSNYIRSVKARNEIACATNMLQFAKATNVWKQVTAGEITFEEAATNNSEDIYLADGCEWGTFSLDQLADDPQIIALLPSLKPGMVTPPVESDEGIAILRLDEIDENKKYTFSRIFFRLAYIFDIPTISEAENHLRNSYQENLIRDELDKTRLKLKIEYPSGTNLFAKGAAPIAVLIPKFRK